MKERHTQPGQRKKGEQERHEDEPVEQQVAQIRADERPGVGREQAQLGRQIIAELPQVAQRLRLRLQRILHRLVLQLLRHPADGFGVMDPTRQPAPDVAAAGNRGEVIKLVEQPVLGQPLGHPQREGRAADAAAGKTQRRAVARVHEREHSAQRVPDFQEMFREGFFEQQPVEDVELLSIALLLKQGRRFRREVEVGEPIRFIDRLAARDELVQIGTEGFNHLVAGTLLFRATIEQAGGPRAELAAHELGEGVRRKPEFFKELGRFREVVRQQQPELRFGGKPVEPLVVGVRRRAVQFEELLLQRLCGGERGFGFFWRFHASLLAGPRGKARAGRVEFGWS